MCLILPFKQASMARDNQADTSTEDSQSDLFDAEPIPSYRPDPEKVRARLHKILAEARAARTFPWEPTRVSLYLPANVALATRGRKRATVF